MNSQQRFSNDDIDRMKADAIRRARQMQSRSSLGATDSPPEKKAPIPQNIGNSHSKQNTAGAPDIPLLKSLHSMIGSLGFNRDQMILIALILMLAQEKDNTALVIALLYIAM